MDVRCAACGGLLACEEDRSNCGFVTLRVTPCEECSSNADDDWDDDD